MGMGADVMLDPNDIDKSFATGRNFGTKLWNIGRFLLDRVGGEPVQPTAELAPASLTRADQWILDAARLSRSTNATARSAHSARRRRPPPTRPTPPSGATRSAPPASA